jgi:hypothetical protein
MQRLRSDRRSIERPRLRTAVQQGDFRANLQEEIAFPGMSRHIGSTHREFRSSCITSLHYSRIRRRANPVIA